MSGKHEVHPEVTPHEAARSGPKIPMPAVIVGVPIVLALVIGLVLIAFGLPGVKGAPHDVPIGVAGSSAAAVGKGLEQHQPGAFDVTVYDDTASLERAIKNRDVYGGFIAGPQGIQTLTASAGSSAVAQALTQIGTGLGATAPARDIVPLTTDDPRGAGLGAVGLPLVIGSIVPAVALGTLARRREVQFGAAVVYAGVAGLTFGAILHYLFGTVDGNYLAESAVLGACVGAGALALLGLRNVFGMAGFGLGAASLVLVANPLSGATTAPEFLATPWRLIGQWMPPGAGSQLMRTVAFFEGGSATPLIVLGVWAAAGVALLAIPARKAA